MFPAGFRQKKNRATCLFYLKQTSCPIFCTSFSSNSPICCQIDFFLHLFDKIKQFWPNSQLSLAFFAKLANSGKFIFIYSCTRFLHSCALCFVQVSPKTGHRCFLHIFDKTTQFREIFSCARCFQQVLAQTARLLVKLMLCTYLKKKSQFQVFSELSLLFEYGFSQTAQSLSNFMFSARFWQNN